MRLYVSQILQDNAEVITDGVTNQSVAVLRQGQFAQVAVLPTEEQPAKLAEILAENHAVWQAERGPDSPLGLALQVQQSSE